MSTDTEAQEYATKQDLEDAIKGVNVKIDSHQAWFEALSLNQKDIMEALGIGHKYRPLSE